MISCFSTFSLLRRIFFFCFFICLNFKSEEKSLAHRTIDQNDWKRDDRNHFMKDEI